MNLLESNTYDSHIEIEQKKKQEKRKWVVRLRSQFWIFVEVVE